MSIPMTRDETPDNRTRPTDEIDPMIPIMPREPSPDALPDTIPDGGETLTAETRHSRPRNTSYATEATQDTEEIVPFVPDLTGTDAE